MALQMNYKIEVAGKDVVFENAYVCITQFFGNKDLMDMQVTVYDKSSKENIVVRQAFVFKSSINDYASNIFKQGYEHLKTLPLFENAIDVLEEGQIITTT